jgi:hypothetical protein
MPKAQINGAVFLFGFLGICAYVEAMPKLNFFAGFLMAVILAAIVFPSHGQPLAGVSGGETKIHSMIDFEGVPFTQVFEIYTNLCGTKKIKVDADESVKKMQRANYFPSFAARDIGRDDSAF